MTEVKVLRLFFLILILPQFLPAQTFTAKVVDSASLNPIPFVNIGVYKSTNGTVSNEKGGFTINLERNTDYDTIGFSLIGYKPLLISIGTLKKILGANNNSVPLVKIAYQLDEVSVKPSVPMKYATFGEADKSSVRINSMQNTIGTELGKTFKIKRAPTFIDSVAFYVIDNTTDTAVFRLNIYKYNSGGLFSSGTIGENILKQDVIVKTSVKEGLIYVDLSKYSIKVDQDFVVALEWIKDYGANAFTFSGSLFGGIYIRASQQDKWEHSSIGAIDMAIKVCYPK
jgi:hypothetical protein